MLGEGKSRYVSDPAYTHDQHRSDHIHRHECDCAYRFRLRYRIRKHRMEQRCGGTDSRIGLIRWGNGSAVGTPPSWNRSSLIKNQWKRTVMMRMIMNPPTTRVYLLDVTNEVMVSENPLLTNLFSGFLSHRCFNQGHYAQTLIDLLSSRGFGGRIWTRLWFPY